MSELQKNLLMLHRLGVLVAILLIIMGALFTKDSESLPVTATAAFKHSQEEAIAKRISAHYPFVSDQELKKIVSATLKYASTEYEFPSVEDILSVIAIESSFNCAAKNREDHGCMQINKRYWGEAFPADAFSEIDSNIRHGVILLNRHYFKNGYDRDAALIAYNKGQSAVNKGQTAPEYLRKFYSVLEKLSE